MIDDAYNSPSNRILGKLIEDRNSGKLSEKEFEILLGFIIEKEFNNTIKWHVKMISPKKKRQSGSIKFMNYEWKSHAQA